MPNIVYTHEFYLIKHGVTTGVDRCLTNECGRPNGEWEDVWTFCPYCGEPARVGKAINMTGLLEYWREVKEFLKDEPSKETS